MKKNFLFIKQFFIAIKSIKNLSNNYSIIIQSIWNSLIKYSLSPFNESCNIIYTFHKITRDFSNAAMLVKTMIYIVDNYLLSLFFQKISRKMYKNFQNRKIFSKKWKILTKIVKKMKNFDQTCQKNQFYLKGAKKVWKQIDFYIFRIWIIMQNINFLLYNHIILKV